MGAVIGPVVAFFLLSYIASDATAPTAREYQQVFLFASIPVAIGLFVIIFFVHEETKPVKEIDALPIKFSLSEFDGNFKRFLVVIAAFHPLEFNRRIPPSSCSAGRHSTAAAADIMDGAAYQQGGHVDHRRRPLGQDRP